jgi:hypothetical protein
MVNIPSSPANSNSKLNYQSAADEHIHTPKMKPPSVSHNILEVQGRESKDVFKIKEKYKEVQNQNALTERV